MKTKTAYMGLFAAAAIIFGYIETLFPVFVTIPGVKLGIANLVTVLVLYFYSWREAAAISAVRIFVIGFLFGNLFSIAYSLAGAVLSLSGMAALKRVGGFSMTGVSVLGGVAHNVGQLVVAMFIVENFSLLYYLPILLVSGVLTGFLIGIVSGQVYIRVLPLLEKGQNGKGGERL